MAKKSWMGLVDKAQGKKGKRADAYLELDRHQPVIAGMASTIYDEKRKRKGTLKSSSFREGWNARSRDAFRSTARELQRHQAAFGGDCYDLFLANARRMISDVLGSG